MITAATADVRDAGHSQQPHEGQKITNDIQKIQNESQKIRSAFCGCRWAVSGLRGAVDYGQRQSLM
jgi:hypothetical protein